MHEIALIKVFLFSLFLVGYQITYTINAFFLNLQQVFQFPLHNLCIATILQWLLMLFFCTAGMTKFVCKSCCCQILQSFSCPHAILEPFILIQLSVLSAATKVIEGSLQFFPRGKSGDFVYNCFL